MSVERLLVELLAVLAAARLAAEAAQRLGAPTVVGEIVAGLVVGPSVLGLATPNEVIEVLAELGAILLLVEVGMELDLSGLRAVGGRALAVALIGVALPFAGGYAAARGLGFDPTPALFAATALTATSVGITARVLSEAQMLSSVEGRTILGAAVADDLLGLMILSVVTGSVGAASASAPGAGQVIMLALGALAGMTLLGLALVPRLLDAARLKARVAGSFLGAVFGFVLVYAIVAGAARLAPILGGFVAGLCLARTSHRVDIARELRPLSHILVPVFFLTIGLQVDVARLLDRRTAVLAAALLLVAVLGKLASGLGVLGAGDGLLVGLGMLPRGEVGLIVTGIGARAGIVEGSMFGALVLTVIGTTLLAPSLLRLRVRGAARAAPALPARTDGDLLRTTADVVDLVAAPGKGNALKVVLEAAIEVSRGRRPGAGLVDWMRGLSSMPLRWDPPTVSALFELLRSADPRAWTFLGGSGVLQRSVPELAELLEYTSPSIADPDPTRSFRWTLLQELNSLRRDPARAHLFSQLEDDRPLLLAAAVLEFTDPERGVLLARRLAKRLELGAKHEQDAAALVLDHGLLAGAARRADALDEERILELAVHLVSAQRARALYLLTLAAERFPDWHLRRLDELARLVIQALEQQQGLTGREAANLVNRHLARAAALIADQPSAAALLEHVPRRCVLVTPPTVLAAQASCLARLDGRARFEVSSDDDGERLLVFAGRDQPGLLARTTAVLGMAGVEITRAWCTTWPRAMAVQAFKVMPPGPPSTRTLVASLKAIATTVLTSPPLPEADVSFDLTASPSYGLCRVDMEARPDALHLLAVAIASARVSIAWAHVDPAGPRTTLSFGLTGRHGDKLSAALAEAVAERIRVGARLESGWTLKGLSARWTSNQLLARLQRVGASPRA